MKISKDKLKTIIKEELEQGPEDNYEGSMAKENLYKIAEYANRMMELIGDSDDLEPWLQEKIAVAAYMMDAVGHHLEYQAHAGHEGGEGEEMHGEYPEEDDGGEEAYVISIGGEEGYEDSDDEYGSDEDSDEEDGDYEDSDDETEEDSDEESDEEEEGSY